MAVGKEIRTKMGSVRNTQKITSAMQMVAASKMRKAQDRMQQGKPYARMIRNVIGHIANSNPNVGHEYMTVRDIKRVGYIVVTTDRGLCGGLNVNLFKRVMADIKRFQQEGVSVCVCPIGIKGTAFFKSRDVEVSATISHVGDTPAVADLIGGVKNMFDAYDRGDLDRVYVVYNHFINAMTQKPEIEQLLPLEAVEDETTRYNWDYVYEPSADELLSELVTRYIETQVYQAVIENNACEQSARMLAMKNATDNAGDLIKSLQLKYNKARQAAITQELSEIVGGAAAV